MQLACSVKFFYSAESVYPLPCFSPARNAALWSFHLGTFSSLTGAVVFFDFSVRVGGGGVWAGCLKPY
jgi:hypothetical protein